MDCRIEHRRHIEQRGDQDRQRVLYVAKENGGNGDRKHQTRDDEELKEDHDGKQCEAERKAPVVREGEDDHDQRQLDEELGGLGQAGC